MRIGAYLAALFGLATVMGCGGSNEEAEASWETHTTAQTESAGGEEEAE